MLKIITANLAIFFCLTALVELVAGTLLSFFIILILTILSILIFAAVLKSSKAR